MKRSNKIKRALRRAKAMGGRNDFHSRARQMAAKNGLPVGGMTTTGITAPYADGGQVDYTYDQNVADSMSPQDVPRAAAVPPFVPGTMFQDRIFAVPQQDNVRSGQFDLMDPYERGKGLWANPQPAPINRFHKALGGSVPASDEIHKRKD